MDEQYKIELGVKLDTSDLKTEINKVDGKHKIKLGVDLGVDDVRKRISQYNANSNNIKVKLKATLDTDDLKKQISKLNLNGASGNKGIAVPINTQSLEASLKDVKAIIADIKNSIGTLDSKSGMKSLLSSINQISSALEKASNQFEILNTNLNALGGKDLSLNFGINLGGSNPIARQSAYGNKARNDTLPQLKQQMNALVKYYNDVYKDTADEFSALQKLVSGTKLSTGDFFQNFMFGKDSVASRMSGGSLSSQMQAYKQYIDMFKQAASLKGLDLSSVTSGFSKSADQLIQDAQDVQTGAKEMDESFEKLKQIFSGGNNLNVEGLSQQLDSIVVDLGEIKTALQSLSSGVSLEGLTQSFDRLSDTIEKLVQNCTNMKVAINDSVSNVGGSVDKSSSGFEKVENDLKQVTVSADNTSDAIQSLRNVMSGMKFNTSSIDAATKDLEEMNVVIKEVSAKQGKDFDITVKGVNELGEAVTVIKRLDEESGRFNVISTQISKPFDEGIEAAKRFKKEAETVKNIKLDIELGTYDNQISQMDDKFNRLSSASVELRESVEQVRRAYEQMEKALESTGDEVADKERLIQAEKEYAAALEKTNNLIRIQARTDKANVDKDKLDYDIKLFQSEIDSWLIKNSAATKRFGGTMLDLKAKAENVDRVTLNGLISQFRLADKEAEKLGLKTQSTFDKLKTKFKEYMTYLSAAELFMYAEQALRSMFEQVKLIDAAMTELKKVTNETDAAYEKFLTNAADRAKAIGTTIDGLVSSTADFARLGYGFEDAQGLAEVANIYAVVGDEIEGVEGATESLISTMAAFKDEMNGMSNSDFAMSIIDKFNEIGNNFAISSGGIGEALERSASSLMAANNTIDESIALITAANTVVGFVPPNIVIY